MTLTGCGANGNFTQSLDPDNAVEGLSGTVHGGPNPVIGATISLYATKTISGPYTAANNWGYGQSVGSPIGTATTSATGTFQITGAVCPAGQYAYIVSSGGHTGTNSANTYALLMAALGPCSGISNSTQVFIDEPTTIAAAYALSGFMNVSGTTVNISAPANNNATTAACTVVSNATTSCAASGLGHAFLNAANLVNSATGYANATITTGATVVGTVPQQLINTLANSVEACINSTGATSTACTTLKGYPNISLNPAISTAPANTLQALLYLARYPVEAASPSTGAAAGPPPTGIQPSAATTAFFNIANSNSFYNPALSSAPLDYTIAINYVMSPGGSTQAPWGIATDIKDNVYVYVAGVPTVYSLASNGALNWATATGTSGGCGTFGTRCGVIPDTLGNVWAADNSGLTQLKSATGVLGTTFTSVDTLDSINMDLGNNVWIAAYSVGTATTAQPAPSDVEELPQGQTTSPLVDVQVNGAPVTGSTPAKDPTFDTAGNMWLASDNAGGGGLGAVLLISSNNSLTAPLFATAGSGNGNPELVYAGTGSHSNAPMIDVTGDMWIGSEDELTEVPSSGTPPFGNGATNYATSGTVEYGPIWDGGVERFDAMDGDGKIVVEAASGNFGFVTVYYPNATYDGAGAAGNMGANVYLNPCAVQSGSTCTLNPDGGSVIVNASRGAAIDDTGAIWATLSSGKNVIQVLGPGAPSWGYVPYIPKAFLTNTSGRPY
ncbi:MAG: hypothetical protein ABSA85_08290 [Terracidiphilus sp.]|jgi:hypothetical protein